MSSNSIFVQVAAYRDPECRPTIDNLFAQARDPSRIFVGVCWQTTRDFNEEQLCSEEWSEQVRIDFVDARESKGVCWARHRTQKLWEGEEYTLQIDSHMRFEPYWDEKILRMLQQCDADKPVLTMYPPGYTPPNALERDYIYGMRPKKFDSDGVLRLTTVPIKTKNAPDKPIPGAVASACFLFGSAKMIEEVPYDPHLYFFGEEISLAVRLWTHGWNIFHPNSLVAYHMWSRKGRDTHFGDNKGWTKQDKIAKARVAHMLGTRLTDDLEALKELELFGLGRTRTLQQYEAHSGIDFTLETIRKI